MIARVINLVCSNLPAAMVAGVAVVLLLAWGAQRIRKRPRRWCPGPRPRWWSWIFPWRWFWRGSACGYDLSGLSFASAGRDGKVQVGAEALATLVCPECGRRVSRIEDLRRGLGRFRALPAGVVLLVLSVMLWRWEALSRWSWLRYAPTLALVAVERGIGPDTPREIQWAVGGRIFSTGLSRREVAVLLPRLIADLRDDEASRNADRAIDMLERIGAAAIPALEAALRSPDWQQRQLACVVLQRIPEYGPSVRMIEVCFEAMRDDAFPAGEDRVREWRYTGFCNGRWAAAYLVRYPGLTREALVPFLMSDDAQQQRAATGLAAVLEMPELDQVVIPRLIAAFPSRGSARALYSMGERAIPAVEAMRDASTGRRRQLAIYLLLDLRDAREARRAGQEPLLIGARIAKHFRLWGDTWEHHASETVNQVVGYDGW